MLGGFKCSRNALIVLNIFYFIVGVILIGLGGHWVTSNIVSSLPIIGGVVACGVFLSIISVVGLVGAAKHHQVALFFYMVILLIVFLIQFSIACACLTVSKSAQLELAKQGWSSVNDHTKQDAQQHFQCCGFAVIGLNSSDPTGMGHPPCDAVPKCMGPPCNGTECCTTDNGNCGCDPCQGILEDVTAQAFSVTGGVSLFFSFTEFFGVWLTYRYRNQKNPLGGNPSAFL
jgi:tetraspanin-13/31